MKKTILLLVLITAIGTSCKKDTSSLQQCWVCQDNLGNSLGTYCGSDEQDAFDHSGTINGVHTINNFQSHCHKQ